MLPNVRLQVVPFTAGMHPGLRAGPFTLLRFPSRGGAEPDEATVHVPGLTGELYLDTPHEIQYYEAARPPSPVARWTSPTRGISCSQPPGNLNNDQRPSPRPQQTAGLRPGVCPIPKAQRPTAP